MFAVYIYYIYTIRKRVYYTVILLLLYYIGVGIPIPTLIITNR